MTDEKHGVTVNNIDHSFNEKLQQADIKYPVHDPVTVEQDDFNDPKDTKGENYKL